MGYIFALAAILAENAGKIFDKSNFIRTQITPKEALRLVFGVMSVSILAFILVTRPELPGFTASVFVLLGLIVGLSFISNVVDENSLKINDLSLREPLSNFHPILAGFIGYWLFPDERNILLLLALVFGGLIVLWGIKPGKLAKAQRLGIIYMASSVLAEGVLSNVYALALESVSPEYIALVRTVAIWILLALLFKPKKRRYSTKREATLWALGAGLVYSLGAIISLYAIDALGIVTTMLLLLLGPALRYASAFIFLRDRPTRSEMISSGLLGLIAISAALI